MDKKENTEMKKYLISFVSQQLEQCPIFTQTFGKRFAQKSLKRNLNKVYTNNFDENVAAFYSTIDRNITFCTNNVDDEKLTVEMVKNNPNLTANMLHEGIHAVLNKGKMVCKINKNIYSTGIFEMTEQGKEYGRGLNEGLTNWICEKIGVGKTTYAEETKFVKQLQLAIGEKRVMKMAKGGIKKNISKQLSMTPDECYIFLKLIDDMHNVYAKLTGYYCIERVLNNLIHIEKFPEEERTKIYYEYEKMLSSNYNYYLMCHTYPYTDFMNRNDISVEDELAYLRKQINGEETRLSRKIAEIESKIFDKYFRREFENMMSNGNIPEEQYEKIEALSQLMVTTLENEDLKSYSSYKFLKSFEQITQNKAKAFRESQKIVIENSSLEKVAIVYNSKLKTYQEAR